MPHSASKLLTVRCLESVQSAPLHRLSYLSYDRWTDRMFVTDRPVSGMISIAFTAPLGSPTNVYFRVLNDLLQALRLRTVQ